MDVIKKGICKSCGEYCGKDFMKECQDCKRKNAEGKKFGTCEHCGTRFARISSRTRYCALHRMAVDRVKISEVMTRQEQELRAMFVTK